MDPIAASTRWAAGLPAEEGVRKLLDLEFEALVVHAGFPERELEVLERLLPRQTVIACELFAPLPRAAAGAPAPFRLGSLHPEERRDAAAQGSRTIELADSLDARLVVLPVVEVDEPSTAGALELLRSRARPEVFEALRKRRADSARRRLDSLLSTLSALLDRADRYGLRLALTLGGPPSELPDVAEAERCLREFRGGPLDLWVDFLRDARYRRTGGRGAERLRGDLEPAVRGFTVEDGDGTSDHLPLGAGEVDLADFEELRVRGKDRPWVLDLDPAASTDKVLASRDRLRTFLAGPEKASKSILAPT